MGRRERRRPAERIREYVRLTKQKQTALLLYSGLPPLSLAGAGLLDVLGYLASVWLAVSGTTALNMYFDRDVDALMERTRDRPLPAGSIPPGRALCFGLILLIAGVSIALFLKPPAALTIALGFLFDIPVYTILLKRRTPLSIVLGGVAGAAPALTGWAFSDFRGPGYLPALVVFGWVPCHIWTLAIHYADDYASAGIPMLPAALGELASARAVSAVGLAISALMAASPLAVGGGPLLWAACLGSALLLAWRTAPLPWAGDLRGEAMRAFKAVNASLGVYLTALILSPLL